MKAIEYWMFLAICFLLSCSVKEELETEEAEQEESIIEVVEPEAFRANRILIKHGLQLHCWVATDNFILAEAVGAPAYNLSIPDWKLTGFTGPTFFGPPLMNLAYFRTFPDSQWSMAKAPKGRQFKEGPTDIEKKEGFLSEDQLKYLDKLTTICFGDEEDYSLELVKDMKDWFDVSRRLYPDALVHNNQFALQWYTTNLRTYAREAKPDLLTFDYYYFRPENADDYAGAKDMATHLWNYRQVALEGWNGDKKEYMAFGQYVQGFAYGSAYYKLTESQLRLYYYMTWTFGGKWVNWFRFLQGNGFNGQTTQTNMSLLLENGMPGHPTKYMDWVNLCNQESKYISDYLVRLKTTDICYIAGSEKYTEGKPDQLPDYNPSNLFLKSVSGSIISEPKESSDLYLGFFDVIPVEEQGDPAFFKNDEKKFFMITNGYTSKFEEKADALTQQVELGIHLPEVGATRCCWINPEIGEKEVLKELRKESGVSYFQVSLKGGSGALFLLE